MIIPAIIPESFEDLESQLLQVRGLVRDVQIDICDGRLTPSKSWPYTGDKGQLDEILKQQRGIPLWEYFDFEIDLMVLNPLHEYETWIEAGASKIVFHYKEADAEVLKEIMQKSKERGVEVSLALHLPDSLDVIESFKDITQSVQLMGIKHIGFQGEPFEEETLEKIKEVKKRYPEIKITIDGGANMDTASRLLEAGADNLVVGSAIFGAPDIRETISYLESLK